MTDSSGNGSIEYLAVNAGALTVAGGAIEELRAECYAAAVNITDGTVEYFTLNDGEDEEVSAAVSGGFIRNTSINGGTLTVDGGDYRDRMNLRVDGGTTNIVGGTFADLRLMISFGEIRLSGGTFTKISNELEGGSSEYKEPTLGSLLGNGCAFYGTDSGSGIKSVKYYKSEKALTDSDVSAVTDWTEKNNIKIAAEDKAKFIVYVRIEDKAGNVTYIGSEGAIFDTVAPELVNDYLENGKTYYTTLNVNVKDDNLAEVTLNGEKVKGTVTLKGDTDAVYTVKATDKAGNETVCTVYMKPISAPTEGIAGITADNVKSDNIDGVNKAIENIGNAAIPTVRSRPPKKRKSWLPSLQGATSLKTALQRRQRKPKSLQTA